MLSLVVHAVGYKMIVGAHNIFNVRCMWEVAFLLVWQTSVPGTLLMPRGMQGVIPCLFGMGFLRAPTTL